MAWPNPPYLRADAPITGPTADRLDRARLAKQIAQRVLGYTGDRALAVGMCGRWGSGKTSFVNMVVESIKEDRGLRGHGEVLPPVVFTPWALGTRDDMARDLLAQIGRSLQAEAGAAALPVEVGTDIAALAVAVGAAHSLRPEAGWLAAALGVVGAVPVVKGLAKPYIDRVTRRHAAPSIQEQFRSISEKLKKSNALLVIALDDLERLPADQIQGVFRVVGALANFTNTVYLLTMDRHRVARALRTPYGNGHAYLEKFLHLTFDLPAPDRALLGSMFVDDLNRVLSARGADVDPDRFRDVWHGGLKDLIETPRDIIRVMNGYDMALDAVPADTDPVDLLALEALRVIEPGAHRALAARPIAVLREYRDMIEGFRGRGKEKERGEAAFAEILTASTKRRREVVKRLLESLFPAAARGGGVDKRELHRKNRAASPDHFDTYFRWSLAAGALSERTLLDAVNALLTADSDDAVRAWAAAHGQHFQQLGEKLFNYLDDFGDPARRHAFAAAILRVGHLLDDSVGFIRSDSMQALSLAYNVLKVADGGWDAGVWGRAKGTGLLYGLVRFYGMEAEDKARQYALSAPDPSVLAELASETARRFDSGEFDDYPRLGAFLYRWRDVARSADGPRAYVAHKVAERSPVVWLILRDLLNVSPNDNERVVRSFHDNTNRENLAGIFDFPALAEYLSAVAVPSGLEAVASAARRVAAPSAPPEDDL